MAEIDNFAPTYFGGECNMDPENRGFYLIIEDMSDTHELLDFNIGLTYDQVWFLSLPKHDICIFSINSR